VTTAEELPPIRRVAVLGTGIMGAPIAVNIARSGIAVSAWNRTASKAEELRAFGVRAVADVAEATRDADAVLTMLFDADAAEAAITAAGGALPAGAVWVQLGTVGPDGTERLARVAERHRLRFVDAPVLGSRGPAEQGALTVLASGPEDLRQRVAPLLNAMGQRVMWLGAAGAGSRLKLAINAWVLALTHATAESVAFCEALGLDPRLFLAAIEGSPTDSPYAHLKAELMFSREYPAAFTLAGALKDATLITELARRAGADLPVAEAVRLGFERAAAAGHAQDDMAAVYEVDRARD
jgi:3-hydroxyisobutyrate dehydrogenase